eukprot:GHVR01188920.1.p1 GENE.GHVR01188920.1~~GHVR01188920.1.p1  ORF type:complete len:250 (+),score=34.02 GHVR01188920.1:213-962(+)
MCLIVLLSFVVNAQFLAADNNDTAFSAVAIGYGVTSSVFQALYIIYSHRILGYYNGNSHVIVLHNLVMSIPLLLLSIFVLDEGDVWSTLPSNPISVEFYKFWLVITFSGMLSVCVPAVTIAMLAMMNNTVSVTVIQLIKSLLQTGLGVTFRGETLSIRGCLGVIGVLFGTFGYSLIKHYERIRSKELKSSSVHGTHTLNTQLCKKLSVFDPLTTRKGASILVDANEIDACQYEREDELEIIQEGNEWKN